jgi:ATP-dependent helicase/nuclease subunit B
VALRPRRLSVTEIQTWLEDPYAIYARHVLNLRKLEPLEQATDAADYGSLVHDGLKLFLEEVGHAWPVNAPARLREKLELALRQAELRPALSEWWTPRLHRIADWVCAQEQHRRSLSRPLHLAVEKDGAWQLHGPAGPFELRGRADRIERHEGGRLAILDYKTGTPPSQKSVAAGFAPQLPLEAAMAAAGAFGPELAGATAELTYWHLTGGFEPGEARPLYNNDADQIAAAVTAAAANLRALIAEFDTPDRAYLSQPHPGRPPRFPDYAQLARVAEWDLSGDAE